MPGSPSHLVRRFFDVLFSKPLTGEERAEVERWLRPGEYELFFAQSPPDQRHGHHAAGVVTDSGVDDPTVVRAALLHDIGKRHAGLGVIGRSMASILIAFRLPLPERARLYRDHGETGARELAEAGCEPMIVDFARSHHGPRPRSIDPATWELLLLADQPPKTGSRRRA